jgi:hypothetical protein
VQRVGAAEPGPLEVELLGEQHRVGIADHGPHRVDQARVARPPLELGREVGEGLDAVHHVAVALPLDEHAPEHVGVEHVATGAEAVALAIPHEVGDQLLGGFGHRLHLVGVEHPGAHDIAEAVVPVALVLGELVGVGIGHRDLPTGDDGSVEDGAGGAARMLRLVPYPPAEPGGVVPRSLAEKVTKVLVREAHDGRSVEGGRSGAVPP